MKIFFIEKEISKWDICVWFLLLVHCFLVFLEYFAERLRDYKGILQKIAYVILEVLFVIVFMFTMMIVTVIILGLIF